MVCTRYKKYNEVDKLPNGMNIVVAIASYTGYNQEDSIIINRSSVERGMFNNMNFKSYEFDEQMDNDGTINIVDVITVVNIIIGTITPTDLQQCAADINQDGTVNVVDVISLVNQIINS
jgi:DNA-directed RNA polymerase beta subunit